MPLVWVAKLLNIPIRERVSGSDLFERLRQQTESLWRVFFFGGPKGVGQSACLAIGDQPTGVLPTGYIYPGFVNTEEMSREDLVHCINQTEPDMVVVALGAAKGQEWICRNKDSIEAPVIGHLGAVINFVAGNVQRAPRWMQRCGLEWIWRAKEETTLTRRYLNDGFSFLRVLLTRVLPLAWHHARRTPHSEDLRQARAELHHKAGMQVVSLHGDWNTTNLQPIRKVFTQVEDNYQSVVLEMAGVRSIDSAFVALLLLLEQSLESRSLHLRLTGTPQAIRRYLHLSNVSHLMVE
jgi:N-acetylglucosaminyldiphosphoundecaprenol N-acetyl-beta-D-mannosaminyltransferase